MTYEYVGTVSRNSKKLIAFVYLSALFFVVYFLLNGRDMFLESVPKMFFPNYYEPGMLSWIRIVFLHGICVPFSMTLMYMKMRAEIDIKEKRRHKFFIWAIFLGYFFSVIPNLLVYNIPINPSLGMIFSITFIIPLFYATLKYEMFSVRIIAKQALMYSIAVVIMGTLITLFNYTEQLVRSVYPGFPVWVIPLISSIIAITVGIIVWRHLREGDVLKYEFITVVTHKFRTPLTHIKWASENLEKEIKGDDNIEQIKYIQTANEKLVELTDLLVNVSGTENDEFKYKYERTNLSELAKDVVATVISQFDSKKIEVKENYNDNVWVQIDTSRIKFIIQTFVENAFHYSLDKGISVNCSVENGNAVFKVIDNGIGIPKDEIQRLFSKFYRGKQAKLSDTEGMGIALFVSKEIIEKHNGKIWAESKGENLGSTFAFSLPAVR
jgi:signal transduction histidine kinase